VGGSRSLMLDLGFGRRKKRKISEEVRKEREI
jgi:hypothetical protein